MLRIHIKRWPMVVHICNPNVGEVETDRCWLARLAYSVSFTPMRDPVSKEADSIPEDDTQGCPMASKCNLTYIYVPARIHTYTKEKRKEKEANGLRRRLSEYSAYSASIRI